MNKSEFKEILKPLIKECIKEVIFDEGVLSGLITEVAKGLGNVQPVVQVQNSVKPRSDAVIAAKQHLNEVKQKMQKASGLEGAFQGTVPMSSGGANHSKHGPLRDQDPNDAGVDISSFMFRGTQ